MFAFLLIVQTLIAVSLIGVILMQRSEGGGLGVGGSSSGFMTARGAADFLTRSTAVLGSLFIVLSIVMAAIAGATRQPVKIDTSLAGKLAPRAAADAAESARPAGTGEPDAEPAGAGGSARAISRVRQNFFARAGCARGAVPLSLDSHGAVHICHRRRGLLAWERPSVSVPRGASPGAWLQGPNPEIRSLSERRSGDDVARISTARSL